MRHVATPRRASRFSGFQPRGYPRTYGPSTSVLRLPHAAGVVQQRKRRHADHLLLGATFTTSHSQGTNPKQASICKRRGRSVEVSHGTNLDDAKALRPWVSSGFVLASIDTDLRVFEQRRDIESLTGSGVTYAGGHVVLRHCFAASAQPLTAAGTLHRLLLPHPVITAERLFQHARLRNNHGANSAYLSRWPS